MTGNKFANRRSPLNHWVCGGGLAMATFALQAAPAFADIAADCKSERDPGRRIAACSTLIGSGNVKGPDLAQAHVHRGAAFHDKALFDDAIKDYDTALGIAPASAAAHYERAQSKVSKSDLDGALADLNAALVSEPKMARALSERAYVWHRKNDTVKALVDAADALKLDPKSSTAYYVRALVYDSRGDKALALAEFAKAIEIKPKALYYFQRGKSLAAKGDKVAAIADYKKTLELDSKYDAAAKLLAAMGADAAPAAKALAQPAAKEQPAATPPIAQPVQVAKPVDTKPQPVAPAPAAAAPAARKPIMEMDYPDALAEIAKLLDQAAKANPPPAPKELAELFLARTGLHFRNGHNDLAMADIERVLKIDPSGIAYALRAALSLDRDLPASVRDCDEASKRDAKNWEVVSICSTTFLLDALLTFKKGPREASFEKFEKLIRLDSENKLDAVGWLQAAKNGAIKIEGDKYSFDANGRTGDMTYTPK